MSELVRDKVKASGWIQLPCYICTHGQGKDECMLHESKLCSGLAVLCFCLWLVGMQGVREKEAEVH